MLIKSVKLKKKQQMNDGYIPEKENQHFQEIVNRLKKTSDSEQLKSFLIAYSKKYPKEYYIFTELSSLYYKEENHTDALLSSEKAMRIEPKDVLVLYNYGMALFLNDKFDEAVAQFNYIRKKSLSSIAYGRHGEGIKWAQSLINDSVYMAGVSYMEKGNYQQAKRLIQRHLLQRKRGIYSDFTKQQVMSRLNSLLKHSD